MKMKKINLMLIVLMSMFMLSFVTAETSGGELVGKQGECISLPQECADCSYVKVTTITLPNMSKDSIQTTMTKDDSSFNYTYCNTDSLGTYVYCTLGDVSGTDTVACKDFEITPQGYVVTTGQGMIYLGGSVFVFILFLISLYFAISIPWADARGGDGSILYIDYKKYLKFVMWFVAYLCLLFFFFVGKGMSYAFLKSTEIFGFFNVGGTILLIGLAPVLIVSSVFLIFSVLTDKKISRAIERGIPIR